MTEEQHIAQLTQEIAELKARMPRHSTPPAMIFRLEELEEELARAQEATPDGRSEQRV